MKSFKMFVFVFVFFLILTLFFYTMFLTLNFFPFKYHIVETTESRLVMETGLFSKERIVVAPENDFELISAIINDSLRRIDAILTGIACILSALILISIGIFHKKENAGVLLFTAGLLTYNLVAFLFSYGQEISTIESFIRHWVKFGMDDFHERSSDKKSNKKVPIIVHRNSANKIQLFSSAMERLLSGFSQQACRWCPTYN